MKSASGAAQSETSLWFADALLPGGWAREVRIRVRDGLISHIETAVARGEGDEAHALAVPGLANLHSHVFQRALAGLTENRGRTNDSFWTWRERMYGFLERLDPDDIEAIAAQACMEMLEAGFTRAGEFHYLHHAPDGRRYANIAELSERIAAAARTTGIGLTLLPVFYAHGNFGGEPSLPTQRRFTTTPDEYARLLDGARVAIRRLDNANLGVAPHSLRAVTPEELSALIALAGEAPIHIHIAEQTAEVEACLAWSGQRPVEWLLGHAPVDGKWCLVHATHITPNELAAIVRSGAVVGLCPITEANLGDGLFPAPQYLEQGGRFGIGTDSNIRIDAAEELRLLEYGQRLHHRARNILATAPGASTGRTLFEGALGGGAQALGIPTAGLRPGAPADIVSLDCNHPSLVARDRDEALDSWIFSAGREAIDCVWRHGRKLVTGGRHHHRDAIAARYEQTMKRLRTN